MKTRPIAMLLACFLAPCLITQVLAGTPKIDFNNDGRGDLAIGAPDADVNGKLDAGSVTVLYGSGWVPALSATNSQLWTKETPGVPEAAAHFERFGAALAPGDFNADGFTDLAIGVPGMGAGGNTAGSVVVIYGSMNGLRTIALCAPPLPCPLPAQVFRMSPAQPGDFFGSALASGDFNFDGKADLAIGAYGHDIPGAANAGAVRVLYGSAKGLTTVNSRVLTLNTTGMVGVPAASDRFGYSLAAGNFDGVADDLAIGIPEHGFGGAVSVVYGSLGGLSPTPVGPPFGGGGNKLWSQALTSFPATDYLDRFGEALATGDFGHDPLEDLAIGVPSKSVAGVPGAGAVIVLYGKSGTGLVTENHQQWTYASPGVVGVPGQADFLGEALTAGNLGYDGRADLAIGIPNRNIAGLTAAGAVLFLPGGSGGLSAINSKTLSMSWGVQKQQNFGKAISAARFGGNSYVDLAIGLPGWPGIQNSQLTGKGLVQIRYGSATGPSATAADQSWNADTSGVPGIGENNAAFGAALSK
jgi:hypothetical protein